MNTEIWIVYNFHVSENIIFLFRQSFKNNRNHPYLGYIKTGGRLDRVHRFVSLSPS